MALTRERSPPGNHNLVFAKDGNLVFRRAVDYGFTWAANNLATDWRINIDQAWMTQLPLRAVQGNLDPAALFAPLPELKAKVHDLMKRTGTRPGHIINLGHGILPETPVDHVRAMVDFVREFKP